MVTRDRKKTVGVKQGVFSHGDKLTMKTVLINFIRLKNL
jgi:hypothetical protein